MFRPDSGSVPLAESQGDCTLAVFSWSSLRGAQLSIAHPHDRGFLALSPGLFRFEVTCFLFVINVYLWDGTLTLGVYSVLREPLSLCPVSLCAVPHIVFCSMGCTFTSTVYTDMHIVAGLSHVALSSWLLCLLDTPPLSFESVLAAHGVSGHPDPPAPVLDLAPWLSCVKNGISRQDPGIRYFRCHSGVPAPG